MSSRLSNKYRYVEKKINVIFFYSMLKREDGGGEKEKILQKKNKYCIKVEAKVCLFNYSHF